MKGKTKIFFSGTSGLVLPIPKYRFPEEFNDKSRLSYYAYLYNSIEVNSIFYKLPRSSTIENWVNMVPKDFRFTFKLSRCITHVKGLDFQPGDVELFMNTISPAKNKKGCLLIQFPPGLKMEKATQIRKLLKLLARANRNQEWPFAMEFRNEAWSKKEFADLLDEYKVTRVIHDLPGSPSLDAPATTGIRYLRFHGPEPNYRGNYSEEILSGYAHYIKDWINNKQTVYVYFNNTLGNVLGNLNTLNDLVNKSTK